MRVVVEALAPVVAAAHVHQPEPHGAHPEVDAKHTEGAGHHGDLRAGTPGPRRDTVLPSATQPSWSS